MSTSIQWHTADTRYLHTFKIVFLLVCRILRLDRKESQLAKPRYSILEDAAFALGKLKEPRNDTATRMRS